MTKPYSVNIRVTATWVVEIHANDEDGAREIAEEMELDEIEAGDFNGVQSVEATDVEEITDVD